MKDMIREMRAAVIATLALAVVCGGLYPLVVFGIAQAVFPAKANGSLIIDPGGVVLGSARIAQGFTGAGYFHPRPSAAGANGYDAAASGGSNLGPTSRRLGAAVRARVAAYRERNRLAPSAAVPPDAVTASGSGLDPHISPGNARLQIPRVAAARGIREDEVVALVERHTEGPQFGLLGEPRVNVLLLNLALDAGASHGGR